MQKTYLLFLTGFLLTVVSCLQKEKEVIFTPEETIDFPGNLFDCSQLEFLLGSTDEVYFLLLSNDHRTMFVKDVHVNQTDTLLIPHQAVLWCQPDRFIAITQDSILLLNQRSNKFAWWINRATVSLGERPVPFIDSVKQITYLSKLYPPIYHNSTISLRIMPAITLDRYYDYPIELLWDLKTDSLVSYGQFPVVYNGDHWWGPQGNELSRVLSPDGNMIFSFPMSDSLFIYNKNGILLKKIIARSGHLVRFPPVPLTIENWHNPANFAKYCIELPRYVQIHNDPYRNCYYRVSSHGQVVSKDGVMTASESTQAWSIMVINRQFQVVGEQLFESGAKYIYKDIHVVPEGLLIRNNLTANKLNRTKIQYTRFKIHHTYEN